MNYISQYPGSVVLYVFVLLLSVILSTYGDKHNKKGFIIALIVILTLFAGFRHESVGTDTANCLYTMEHSTISDLSINAREIGYRAVNAFLYTIFGSGRITLVVYAFLITYLFVMRLWELKDKINFPISIIVFYSSVYLQSFNILRQSIAIAIFFYGIRYLEKGKNLKFFIAVVIAATFHLSAVVGLLVFIVYDFFTMDLRAFKFSKLFQYGILVGVVYVILNVDRTQLLISMYITSGKSVQGYGSFLTISAVVIFYIAEVFLRIAEHGKIDSSLSSSSENDKLSMYRTVSMMFIVGTVLSAVLSNILYVSRTTYYYLSFSTIFYTYKTRWKILRNAKLLFCILIVVRDLYSIFLHSGMGIMPYLFFWN